MHPFLHPLNRFVSNTIILNTQHKPVKAIA